MSERQETQSPIRVELRTRARYGKRTVNSEYAWQAGEETVPRDLVRVCEALARASVVSGTFISLVAESGGTVWLLRVFREGVDSMSRAIAAVEVSAVVSPLPLPLRHWLGLSVVSLQPAERERIGVSGQFAIEVPPAQAEPEQPDADTAARASLGLPLSVNFRVALSLLTSHPWRYRGVCFALSGRPDRPAAWVDELVPYLCVNFAEPVLSEQEQTDLEAALSRTISQAELGYLSEMDAAQSRAVLRWARNPTPPFPYASAGDQFLGWLKQFRSAHYQGARLLAVLHRDLSPHRLPEGVIGEAARGLTVEAATFLDSASRGEPVETSPAVIEELGRGGFLDLEECAPLRLWARYAADSLAVAESAIDRFTRQEIPRSAAEFVLDLDGQAGAPGSAPPPHLLPAAEVAAKYGLPPPRRRLTQSLASITVPDQLTALREVGSLYGDWARGWARATLDGAVPPPGLLNAGEMLAAAEFRRRMLAEPKALLLLLISLLNEGRKDEAAAVWQEARGRPSHDLSPAACAVVEAHLGLAAPASALLSLAELKLLAYSGLASPEDLLPEDSASLLDCARVWPRTQALVHVIEERRGDVDLESLWFPEHWGPSVRQSFTPDRATEWLRAVDQCRLGTARRWLSRLHGFDPLLGEMLSGSEPAEADSLDAPKNLPWLATVAASLSKAERLRGLAGMAGTDVAVGREALADAISRALLPGVDEASRTLAAYSLNRVGPFPSVEGVSPELVLALTPALDVVALINAIFISQNTGLSSHAGTAGALVERLRATGSACPPHGYSLRQRQLHVPLASALAQVPGWESLAPDAGGRARYAVLLLRQLGLEPGDLLGVEHPSEGPAVDSTKLPEKNHE
jgi:hypothetical protein